MARKAPYPLLPEGVLIHLLTTEHQADLAVRFGVSETTIMRWRRRTLGYTAGRPGPPPRRVDPVQAVELSQVEPPQAPWTACRVLCTCAPQHPTCAACRAWEDGFVLELDGTQTLRLVWVQRWVALYREAAGRPASEEKTDWMPI